jgi:ABC-type lipoprotein release transport system permease subunit
VLALVVAFSAAVVPARRAALMQPVEVLKAE